MGIPDPLTPPGPARVRLCPLSPALLIGLGALQAALGLAFVDLPWAALPLGAFVVLMVIAPFFPAWRLFLPVVRRGRNPGQVALSFDDGPDRATTAALLDLLARYSVPATFFLVGRAAQAEPELVRRILEAGHEIGNHSFDHDPGLMLRGRTRLRRSIGRCQQALEAFGVRPLVFRPPASVVNPRLWRVLLEHGLVCVLARCRGLDFGNRRLSGLARRVLSKVRGKDIIGLHDRRPPGGRPVQAWLDEVERILVGLSERGLEPVLLSTLLGQSVMEPADTPLAGPLSAVRGFYDALAAGYDAEQEGAGQGRVRTAERDAILVRLPELLTGRERVLELGAGTGRFSLELARRAASVLAVDLSAGMLSRLEAKATAAGLDNLKTQAGDLSNAELPGPFELICAFSVFEYVPDLDGLLTRLADRLASRGRLYFTTARRGPLRWVGQVGNALRQGIWLSARSRTGVRRALAKTGLEPELVRAFGPGGVLIEVLARKR